MGDKDNYFKKIGYKYFGPLLLEFSFWLKYNLEKNEIKEVYFLSRDGKIMKEAFDIINKNSDIKSYYFYTSRRAIIVPSLHKLKNPMDIFNCIAFNKKIKLSIFIRKVGLEDTNINKYMEKYHLNSDYELDIENVNSNTKFLKFLDDIFEIIKDNSKKEYDFFRKYCKKVGGINKKIAIVDIGWYGSMQKSFEKLLPDINIFGYYMGIVPIGSMISKNYEGFLFMKNHKVNNYEKLHYFINIFEFLFLATEGSTKRYSLSGYELYEYEYENHEEKEYAQSLQKMAIKYINDNYDKFEFKNDLTLSKKIINKFLHPSYKDAINFGDIKFKDDETKYIAKPHNIIYYLRNRKMFITDFINSSWRIGFLKRLFIIPLPYYQLNKIIRKIYFVKEKKNEKN